MRQFFPITVGSAITRARAYLRHRWFSAVTKINARTRAFWSQNADFAR
jgi:hypothetical protein